MTALDPRLSLVQPITPAALEASFARILGTSPGPAEQSFLAQAHEDYAADETPELGGEDLAALLAASWRAAKDYPAGSAPLITVGPLAGAEGQTLDYDLVRIIQTDAPFLVDSVMGALAEAGVSVRALFHPVVELDGRRLSVIMLVIDGAPQERRDALGEGLADCLADVHVAVADHEARTGLMRQAVMRLEETPPKVDPAVLAENIAFLKWLKSDHFVFLGARDYDYPRAADGDYEAEAPLSQSGAGLGILADPERTVLRRASEPAVLTRQMRRQLDFSEPVTVAKANARSRVHRRAYMDYIGVKRYGPDGKATGETRFVGLFTSDAYDQLATETPLIRRKVANVLARANKAPGSHNEKRLRNILENYPRDELFQMGEDELLSIALGILHLYDRPRIRLFTRQDPFDRFVSVLCFIPREKFDAAVRERIGQIVARAWGGRISAWYPQLSDAPLVRVHFIIGVTPGEYALATY